MMEPHSMKTFYEDPAERERWGSLNANEGLYPTEEHLVSKYVPGDGRVLNIGCGGGREALAMARMGMRVTAVDLDPDYVRLCADHAIQGNLQIDCRVMDAMQLDFSDESFDAVVMVGQMIGHIRGRANRVTALREARRVLRPGGIGVFSTNSIEISWKYRVYFALANFCRSVYNPHGMEPDDAHVFRKGSGRKYFFHKPEEAVFHWYRVAEFQRDLAASGWRPQLFLRRIDFEGARALDGSTVMGETFHVANKEAS
jgi:2-polyprenyl-3-methyl-5-hydroxy-6-metoxy-1,4-benzoquinol methylase